MRVLPPGDNAAGAVYAQCVRPSLLQSPAYGDVMAARSWHDARRVIIEKCGQAVGMAQWLEGTLGGGFFHSMALDGGPVWLPGHGDDADHAAFFSWLARAYPARATRWRRLIPGAQTGLADAGWRHSAGSVNQTIWLDLHAGEATLYSALRKNWRYDLRRAMDSGLRLEWDETGRTLPWLVRHEAMDRRQRGYRGPSAPLIMALARRFLPTRGVLTGRALLAGRPVAGVMLLLHPPAATWLIGWSGPEGRTHHAHNLLLWDGLRILKQSGIGYFDLGGVNDESARNIKHFKEGMGGQLITQPGLYR